MSTTFAEPNQFQDAGEVCGSCRLFWEHQGLPAMELVYVRDGAGDVITTERRGIPIVVCPRCDSDTILRLSKE